MKRKLLRSTLSVITALALTAGMMPTYVFAVEDPGAENVQSADDEESVNGDTSDESEPAEEPLSDESVETVENESEETEDVDSEPTENESVIIEENENESDIKDENEPAVYSLLDDESSNAALDCELDPNAVNGVDFSLLIDENNEVYWQLAVSSFDKLASQVPSGTDYAKVEVLPQNGEEYPYLYPDEGEWKIFVVADKLPSWFSEDSIDAITAAFTEWKEEAYSLVDLDVLLTFSNPLEKEVNMNGVNEEIQTLLDEWAEVDSNWMTCYVRNSVPTTTQSAVGMSIANDAWNFIVNMVWTQAGEDLAGHSQVDLIAAFVGSAFTGIEKWEGYFGTNTGYPFQAGAELLKAGYLYANGLYSAKQVKEANDKGIAKDDIKDYLTLLATPNTSPTGNAFAVLVDNELNVYWKMGVDFCSGLLTEYGFSDGDVVQINLTPEKGDSYFTADSSNLTLSTLGTIPAWYEENSEEISGLVREAFDEWQEQLLEKIDVEALNNTLKGLDLDYATPMSQELFDLFKEWVAVWNDVGVAGSINIGVSTEGYTTVGKSIWNSMDDTVLANYKSMDHEGCPGPTTSSFIAEYALETYGKVIDSATDDYMGSTMNDGYSALVGSFIRDFNVDENGNYKYQAAADLWEAGCIPFYDGEYWYLVSGPDYEPDGSAGVKVIFSATNDQMLDDSFEYVADDESDETTDLSDVTDTEGKTDSGDETIVESGNSAVEQNGSAATNISEGSAASGTNAPKTGDTTDFTFYLIILGVCVVGAGSAAARRFRK